MRKRLSNHMKKRLFNSASYGSLRYLLLKAFDWGINHGWLRILLRSNPERVVLAEVRKPEAAGQTIVLNNSQYSAKYQQVEVSIEISHISRCHVTT